MTEAKHTPGPWKSGPRTARKQHISGPGWCSFARVWVRVAGCDEDNEEGLANAGLIIAAPEMLEALQQIAALMSAGPKATSIAIEAIAKATGSEVA